MSRTCLRLLVALSVLVIPMAGAASAQLTATPVVGGLSAPLGFIQHPADPAVQFIVEKAGRIRVLQNGVLLATDFLSLVGQIASNDERGLLGLAFPPDHAATGRFYVNFTNADGHTVIARFQRSAGNALVADPASRFDLRWPDGNRFITQPYTNHNGGHIAFGPDGLLYVGMGDGGSGNDPQHYAQNPQSLLGKMLRIDVSVDAGNTNGYVVPTNNPFVGQTGVLGEIWSFGLRNPWRWSFDFPRAGSTGALLIADVGQGAREEINYEPFGVGGRNYGWRNREGTLANVGTLPPFSTPLRDPIFDYERTAGRSVTGGYVYRGAALGSTYFGRYFFADFATSRVWSLALTVDPITGEATASGLIDHTTELGTAATSVSSFGVDASGELYLVGFGGAINRIAFNGTPPAGTCTTPDPYAAFGGGYCVAGTWRSSGWGNDFGGDNRPDLMFQNTSGQLYSWFLQNATLVGGGFLTPGQVDANLRVAAINDLNGDGRPDLVLQHRTTGAVSLFLMNGLVRTAEQTIPIAANTPWRVVATADVNDDSYADLVWQHNTTGNVYVWFMRPSGGFAGFAGNGGAFSGAFIQTAGAAPVTLGSATQRIAGALDANHDGATDLLVQDDATGQLFVWLLAGSTRTAIVPFTPGQTGAAWRIRAVEDLNGDQHADLVWQHTGTGDLYVWYLVGSKFASGRYLTPSRVNLIWDVTGPR